MKRILIIASALLLTALGASAQREFGGLVRFDSTVHDFGKVDTRDGAVSCSFTVTNISEAPLNILAVTTTCTCTSSTWTRNSIAPGEDGKIEVTFTNDEGPYPFDKTLTVYLSDYDKPVVLHVKGTAFTSKKRK